MKPCHFPSKSSTEASFLVEIGMLCNVGSSLLFLAKGCTPAKLLSLGPVGACTAGFALAFRLRDSREFIREICTFTRASLKYWSEQGLFAVERIHLRFDWVVSSTSHGALEKQEPLQIEDRRRGLNRAYKLSLCGDAAESKQQKRCHASVLRLLV